MPESAKIKQAIESFKAYLSEALALLFDWRVNDQGQLLVRSKL